MNLRTLCIGKTLLVALVFSATTTSATVELGSSFYQKWIETDYGRKDVLGYQYLVGYVAGLYDAYEEDLYKCIGESVQMTALVDAVGKFLQVNPSAREYPVTYSFLEALRAEWGCR